MQALMLLTRFVLTMVVGVMVFNATFKTISAMLWWSVLLVEQTGGAGENHQSVASHWQTKEYWGTIVIICVMFDCELIYVELTLLRLTVSD